MTGSGVPASLGYLVAFALLIVAAFGFALLVKMLQPKWFKGAHTGDEEESAAHDYRQANAQDDYCLTCGRPRSEHAGE